MEINGAELYRVLTRSFINVTQDDVKEVIQATIVYAWEQTTAKEPPLNQQAYATVVAKRMLMKAVHHRKRFIYPDREMPHGWETLQEEEGFLLTERPIDDEIDARELLRGLPDMYASILRMHYMEGLPLEEIARTVKVKGNTMRKRHQRALTLARAKAGQGAIPFEDP